MNNAAGTKQLLQQYYGLSEIHPDQREKSKWMPENNFGFLLGIIAFGIDTHITQLHSLLENNNFKDQEQAFIDSMFNWYIRPFHKSYNDSLCHTPSKVSSRISSRIKSAEDLEYVPEGNDPDHTDLKAAVEERDAVCLFCWEMSNCEAAHIIAKKNIAIEYDESSILQRAGLIHKHQVQNGFLLCKNCHNQYDLLKRYVDAVDDKLVVKVVSESNDLDSEKPKIRDKNTRKLEADRKFYEQDWILIDNRKAVEPNEEMALYFVGKNPNQLPNRNALEFHKTACLIWRMAGGSEPDEEYCSDDEEQGPVDTAALRKRFNLPAEDSSTTLNQDTEMVTFIQHAANLI